MFLAGARKRSGSWLDYSFRHKIDRSGMKSVIGMHLCYSLLLRPWLSRPEHPPHYYLLPQRILRPQLRIPATQVLLPALLFLPRHPRTTP